VTISAGTVLHGTFRENPGLFIEHSGNIQELFQEYSWNFEGIFREHSGNIQGT